MSAFSRLFTAALVLAATGIASATIITLDSYGTNAAAGAAGNSALAYTNPGGATTTYNIPAAGDWGSLSGASWVSFNPNTYPGGSVVAPNATYTYTTTFTATSAYTGSISVLADDATTVLLNGIQIGSIAAPGYHTAKTINLSGLADGANTLSFLVAQTNNGATGVDFAGSVNTAATPEPSSLILLGTGVLSAAGAARRRFRS